MKPIFLLFAIALSYCCNANCLLSKVTIDNRTKNSQTIIDGEVTAQHSCWNTDKSAIYTVNTIQVNGILKGSATSTIEIITPGGEIDGRLLVVEPNAELKVGSKGIFFLTDNTVSLNYSSRFKSYEIFSLAQGFIELDKYTGKYSDPFEEYQTRSNVYGLITKTTGINYRESNPEGAADDVSGDASISLFTPATISAGTQSVLTISGWGFGNRTGQATVQFRDANSTSSSVFTNIPDTSYIVSWSNTEIKVIVPGASANRQPGAGTGIFNVITANGVVISSLSPLNISYNQFEYKKNKIAFINQNGNGGYTFTLNSDFNNNAGAKESFTKALEQWKCKTGVNVTINTATSATSCSNQLDNTNIISFSTASCPLPAGALGVTYSSYTLCAGSPIIPDGIDMIFNPNIGFYYGSDATPSNQYDFQTVALHELGHAFGQGHNSNGAKIMYPSIANGVAKRTLSPNSDLVSVNEIITRSTASSFCGYLKHVKGTTVCTSNQQVTPITTQFITDKINGCAPLTVKFTDQSLGSPTSWRWDIGNNGSVEYTTNSPSHTFTTAGTYTIKLVALNDAVKDSVVKTALITVAPTLNASIDLIQNVTCNGSNNGSLKAIPTGGNGNYTYTWNNNQTSSTASGLIAGNYNVTVKDGYNCVKTISKSITQPEKLSVSINTTLVSGNTYTATLNVTGGTTPYTYLLNNVTALSSNIISNINAGNYAVSVKDNNNCIQNATFSVSAPTGIVEAENSFDNLEVYPNPATNNVNINFSLKDYKTVNVELYDLAGQIIFQDQYENIKDKQASVDLSYLSSGTYILKFGLPEGNTFRKIIVSK